MVAFILCNETAVELTFNLVDELLRIGNDDLFLRRDDDVGNGDRHTGDAGIVIAEVLTSSMTFAVFVAPKWS